MMNVDWRLYEIVEKAHNSKDWGQGKEWPVLEDEWRSHLSSMGVHFYFTVGTRTPLDLHGFWEVMTDVMKLLSETKKEDCTACPDPRITDSCAILLFPNELAEKILVLGGLP